MKNLYLLSQDQRKGYDTFDCCVVVAESEEEAKKITPNWFHNWDSYTWCDSPQYVTAEYLGKLDSGNYSIGDVVIASFNAG